MHVLSRVKIDSNSLYKFKMIQMLSQTDIFVILSYEYRIQFKCHDRSSVSRLLNTEDFINTLTKRKMPTKTAKI